MYWKSLYCCLSIRVVESSIIEHLVVSFRTFQFYYRTKQYRPALQRSTIIVFTEKDKAAAEAGGSVTMTVGQKKSSFASVGLSVVGAPVGVPVGAFVSPVGMGVTVGFIVGAKEGSGDIVGLELGIPVGLGVEKRSQPAFVASTQVGVKALNCTVVSNTEKNGQRFPLLFFAKFKSLLNVLPKTATSADPTKLFRKHDFFMFTGPSDSTM